MKIWFNNVICRVSLIRSLCFPLCWTAVVKCSLLCRFMWKMFRFGYAHFKRMTKRSENYTVEWKITCENYKLVQSKTFFFCIISATHCHFSIARNERELFLLATLHCFSFNVFSYGFITFKMNNLQLKCCHCFSWNQIVYAIDISKSTSTLRNGNHLWCLAHYIKVFEDYTVFGWGVIQEILYKMHSATVFLCFFSIIIKKWVCAISSILLCLLSDAYFVLSWFGLKCRKIDKDRIVVEFHLLYGFRYFRSIILHSSFAMRKKPKTMCWFRLKTNGHWDNCVRKRRSIIFPYLESRCWN